MDAPPIAMTALERRGARVPLARSRDEALARFVASGSEWAFAALYQRYGDVLHRYCRSILRHDADAQDALQATFAAAFGALRAGRRDAPVRPWLFRIAHNQAITVLRQRRIRDEVPEDLIAVGADVEARATEREELQQLIADLRALPDRQRSALVMRELGGLSHDEIAVALEVSPAAAKQTIFEARRTLVEYNEGRAMSCDQVCRTVSDGDKRTLRSRRVRAHLRQCAACAAFAEAIPARSTALRALTPGLPPAAAAGILARAVGGSGSSGATGGAAVTGLAGKTAVTVVSGKVAAGVAVVSATLGAVAVVKADRPASPLRPDDARTGITLNAAPHATAQRAVTGATGRAVVQVRSRSGPGALNASRPHGPSAPVSAGPKRSAALATGSSTASATRGRGAAPTKGAGARAKTHGVGSGRGAPGNSGSVPGRAGRSSAAGNPGRGRPSRRQTHVSASSGRGSAATAPATARPRGLSSSAGGSASRVGAATGLPRPTAAGHNLGRFGGGSAPGQRGHPVKPDLSVPRA